MQNAIPVHNMEIHEAIAHRVFQRNDHDIADIPFELRWPTTVTGRVEARITSADYSTPWQASGQVESATSFTGSLADIPIGQYTLEIRLITHEETITASVDPLFVGDLWILAGQSNMEGCGKLIDVDLPQVGISCLYMGDTWDIAQEPLCWLNESLDPINWTVPEEDREQAIRTTRRDRTQGSGLGIPFAKELMRYTGIPVGLIMCAHGGTSMAQWDPALANRGGHSLYGAMIRKINKIGGKVKGCLWYQGESDANEQAGPLYLDRMEAWVNQLRHDVQDANLPFILAQLSIFHVAEPDATWWNNIQHDQLVLETSLEGIAMVPTIDATMSDAIHLDSPSLREVGKRMAWRALRLSYDRNLAESGPRPQNHSWNEERTELQITLSGVNERLQSVDKVYGFRVEADGINQPLIGSISEDGTHVVLRFERPVPAISNCQLWHGAGFNPTCNVKDAKRIPLAVYGPVWL